MEKDQDKYMRIGKEIHSDSSPVGIDAKKTHILILMQLEKLQEQMNELSTKLESLEGKMNQ